MQDLFVRVIMTYLLSLISFITHTQEQVKNNSPVVKIIKPKTGDVVKWNTLIPYAINVDDVEDGKSDYEEIADREVILIFKYLKDSSLVNDYLAKLDQDLMPLFSMSKSTCLSCHAATNKLIGPSFNLLAKRNGANDNVKAYLTEKVLTGGSGIWGEEKMPPHPGLNKEEVDLMVDWILRQEDNPTQFYIGLEGTFRTQEAKPRSDKEVYVLTAAYEDHGLPDSSRNQKHGLHTITVKVMH